ncbi:hypothetical protein BAUCODRAFT_460309 [Baudoinia panamericana UAMH 10762]|uniref:Delta(24)-sterol reductase n=1 Tax=Baudoinia panamericana (strain UAMH 10762) TaxID=717646 RepID=M2NEG2_BAUPA|nr:uncharacterized protein BAUCODRAFT_460309 [Baudoinia panamericana UAMH 10762]EMC97624.1 hypothetical protein BAUCODRAFT_460309 [Baudoinia panamericana UAMH 10762]
MESNVRDEETRALKQHDLDVADVAAQVRAFHQRGEQFRIYHGSTNSTRKSALGRDPRTVVDTSRLNRVLYVDAESKYAQVEPNVPMDKLVEQTLKHGLIPSVVMEFPGITVGGGYAGTAAESSSFRHGFFDRTMDEVEMVLANGEVVTCSEKQREDLFRGAAGAVGTLGVVSMVKLQLRKATKFVATTYHPVSGMKEAMAKLQSFTSPSSEWDYVDGIMYSRTQGAIITGRMTDTANPDIPIQRFSAASDPWFYLHVRDHIKQTEGPITELVPLPEYLFRYDRGGFWVGAAAYSYFPGVPFNSLTRWFLDDFLHTRMMYNALHSSGQSERIIVQDLALPYGSVEEFVDFTDSRLGIWPLWLCPLKQSPQPTMHPHLKQNDSDGRTLPPMLNVGLWGLGPTSHEAFVQANRDVEQRLHELGGMKWLYAQTYYTEEAFWQDFDKGWYDGLRKKYHATSLPSVYDKVRVDVESERKSAANRSWLQTVLHTWPFSGLYGLKKAIDSGDYLLARNAEWKNWVPRA